ncbi:MAG: peptidoglycan DD-metalloendopeptidase family protein [Saprospiraceae bacterium]
MNLKKSLAKLKVRMNSLDRQKLFFATLSGIAAGFVLFLSILGIQEIATTATKAPKLAAKLVAPVVVEPAKKYGFILDSFQLTEASIKPNEFLSDILTKHEVPYARIDALVRKTQSVFDVRNLRAGKDYTIFKGHNSETPDFFVYEPSVYRYIVFDLRDTMNAYVIEKEIVTKIRTASGVIESSLWNTMMDNGLSMELTAKMEDAFAWSIDFHHIQKNDRFKLIFEQEYIDDKPVGVGAIQAAYFQNFDQEYYAISYENDKYNGFYDLEARPMKKAFLKSPVKYSRISSRFNLRRFHPVLRRTKAHLGTDYAAPRGTPIFAVADGVVTKASRTRGNGNFVKIKHDDTYQTQYLHMNRHGKGIRPGVHVKQGEVIGYVGSTGLATGPHVCFRFWKNGRQVNHLRENLPPPEPMAASEVPKFNLVRDTLKASLDLIKFPNKQQMVLEINSSIRDSILLNP